MEERLRRLSSVKWWGYRDHIQAVPTECLEDRRHIAASIVNVAGDLGVRVRTKKEAMCWWDHPEH